MSTNRIPGSFIVSGPVADGVYEVSGMDTAYEKAYVNFRFFDASGRDVSPGAGTVEVQMSPDGFNYQDIPNGTFNAADVYLGSRPMPLGEGPAVSARVTLAGITTAVGFRATIHRY